MGEIRFVGTGETLGYPYLLLISTPDIKNYWYLKVNFLKPENLRRDISSLGLTLKSGYREYIHNTLKPLSVVRNSGIEPISIYTKFLVTARCKYESQTKKRASQYCPGYSDTQRTPFQGSKMDKLRQFSDVFCSSCPTADRICQQLFCPPDYMIVDIAVTMMDSLCSELDTEGHTCHDVYCPNSRRKKSLDREMVPPGLNIEDGRNNITCEAAGDWSTVAGMDDWCTKNCPIGNDDTTCLAEYCTCHSAEVTTVPASSLENCANWTASVLYSQVRGMEKWCEKVCRLGICPPSHCQCAVIDARPTTFSDETSFSSSSTAYTFKTTSKGFSATSSVLPTSTPSPSTSVPTSQNKSISTMDSDLKTSTTTKPTIMSSSSLPTSSSIATTEYSMAPQTSVSNTKLDPNSSTTSKTSFTSSSYHSSKSSISPNGHSSTATLSKLQTKSTKWTTKPFNTRSTTSLSSTDISSTISTTLFNKSSPLPSTSSSPPLSTSPTSSPSTSQTPSTSTAHSASSTISSTSPKLPTNLTPKYGSSSTSITTASSVGTISSFTVEPSTVPSSTTEMSGSTNMTTTKTSASQSTRPPINETEILNGGFNVMSNVVCAHTLEKNQDTITKRFCQSESKEEDNIKTGYSSDIIDRVLRFAPRLMCSFMTQSKDTNRCSSFFCGETPVAESVLKSSMCSVCRKFHSSVGSGCSLAYCS